MNTASPLLYTALCQSFVPSESTDAVLSMSPARARAREDFPTPFCPSRAIRKGPSGLPSTVTVRVSSKAGLKLIGETEGPAAPDAQSHSSWTASSRLSWCLIGRGVLPLRTVGVLDRVMLSHWRREGHALYFIISRASLYLIMCTIYFIIYKLCNPISSSWSITYY